jgi:uncharacterized RDD family membrane protein YckC
VPTSENNEAPNPYAPPVAVPVAGHESSLEPIRLASRSSRLAGYLIDLVLAYGGMAVIHRAYSRLTGQPTSYAQSVACLLAAMAVQWAVITWRGQTIGKFVVRTRIARANGANPGFVRGVALRTWPLLFVQLLPIMIPSLRSIALLIWVADLLPILRADRRCAHDHIAGTFVVDARG